MHGHELCRTLFASSGGIHSHLHTQKSNVTVVCSCAIVYTHIRARIKSQPSRFTHSHSVCMCMPTSCCLLPSHCQWCGCIGFENSTHNKLLKKQQQHHRQQKQQRRWFKLASRRRWKKTSKRNRDRCVFSVEHKKSYIQTRGFTWKRILMDKSQSKIYFKWFFYFEFFKLGVRHKMKGRRRYMI